MGDPTKLYAIRDTETGKLINAKCGHAGKYYSMQAYAEKRKNELNKKYNTDKYKLVTYKLIEE